MAQHIKLIFQVLLFLWLLIGRQPFPKSLLLYFGLLTLTFDVLAKWM